MTHKDYELLADAIVTHVEGYEKSSQQGTALEGITTITLAIANALRSDNPIFDTDRFLMAAGVKNEQA